MAFARTYGKQAGIDVFYAEEACSAIADAMKHSYARDGAGGKMHMHIEPDMMHCYASAPVFRESR